MKSSKMDDIKVKQALMAAYHAKENNGPEVSEQVEADRIVHKYVCNLKL